MKVFELIQKIEDASPSGLKIEVKFEAPAEGDLGKTKADEARTGLRDLGLNDNIDVS